MAKDVIVALDFSSKEELMEFIKPLPANETYIKIGMELYYKYGNEIVRELKASGYKIFLDLKLYDIPNTVYRAMKNLAELGVDMINVHAGGASEMMQAAKAGLIAGNPQNPPLLIAVTILTSTSEEIMQSEMQITSSLEQTVINYAKNAYQSGCDGVVCSPLEAKIIKENTSSDFLTVTPGVRRLCDATGDQKRVMTPTKARENQSDYIVVGRPITQNENPKAAYEEIKAEFLGSK